MIGNMQALLKRELWEHRSIFVTPVAIAIVLSLLTVLALRLYPPRRLARMSISPYSLRRTSVTSKNARY